MKHTMKITAVAIAALSLVGCNGIQSGANLVIRAPIVPSTEAECLQRQSDKDNLAELHDVASAAYDAATGMALLASTMGIAPITVPVEIAMGIKAGSTVSQVAGFISEQKDSVCNAILDGKDV